MNHPAKLVVKRDGRLALSLLLFVVSAGALVVEGWIISLWFFSALNQDWTYVEKLFPSALRPPPPGAYCMGDCTPDLPFVAGAIGIVSFFAGLLILAHSWWRPRRHDSP
jgi:hypothetical protein